MSDSSRHHPGGDQTPEGPLVFSVPTSLQEYMSRYVDRRMEHGRPLTAAGTLPPETFPVRNWFGSRSRDSHSTTTDTRPVSSSPLRAAAPTYEYNPSGRASPSARVPVSPRNAPAESMRGAGAPTHPDFLAAWRAMSWPPLVRPTDSVVESEGQPQPRRRARDHGSENSVESSGGGVGRRRVQARSASRGGRPQSSTDARRAGGGLGGGISVNSGSSGWISEGDGDVVNVPFSPMNGTSPGYENSDRSGSNNDTAFDARGHWQDGNRSYTHAPLAGNSAMPLAGWHGRGFPNGEQQQQQYGTVDDRSHVVENYGPPGRGNVVVQSRGGRRSLSDFLREIEEMLVAQRQETAAQQTDGTNSRPVAAAAPTDRVSMQDYFNSVRGSHYSGGSPYVRGNPGNPPTGERRWRTGRRNMSRAAADGRDPSQRPPTAASASFGRGVGGAYHRHHPAARELPEGDHNTYRESTRGAQTGWDRAVPNLTFTPHGIPTLASAAATAVAAAGAGSRPGVAGGAGAHSRGSTIHVERSPPMSSQAPRYPRVGLSATATAFSMPAPGGSAFHSQQALDVAAVDEDNYDGSSSNSIGIEEEIARVSQGWRQERSEADGRFDSEPRRVPAHPNQYNGETETIPDLSPTNSETPPISRTDEIPNLAPPGHVVSRSLPPPQLTPEQHMMSLYRMIALPAEEGAVTPGNGGMAPPSATAAVGRNHGSGTGAGARITADRGQSQGSLAALQAFRHWESQRARLRIQWHDPNAQPESAPSESPAPSDGTLVLTEHLSPSNRPSPRGWFGTGSGAGGDEEANSKVEEALFDNLMSLGVRRLLLLERGERGIFARDGNRRSPAAWLEEWLDGGAKPYHSECSSIGPSGCECHCPRVGHVWELLELLLGWWADRVCAVAAGLPTFSSGQVAAVPGESAGAVMTGNQQRQGRDGGGGGEGGGGGREGRRSGVENSANTGGPCGVVATRAVKAVQDLRKLGEFLLPLSRVREFVGVDGGPTPRDAVLLKCLLMLYEGIAWAVDRPHYRQYREEVIPTALQLYASLPQDVLEGVDLEVGHMLPESMFVMTGTVRPSWPRWGGSPSATGTMTPSPVGARGAGAGGRVGNTFGSDAANRGSGSGFGYSSGDGTTGGAGSRRGRFVGSNPYDMRSVDGAARIGAVGGGVRCATGGDDGVGNQIFSPGPWVIFRVAREEYLEFYGGQAVELDRAVGGSMVESEHMLM